jgi:hypothetical protein
MRRSPGRSLRKTQELVEIVVFDPDRRVVRPKRLAVGNGKRVAGDGLYGRTITKSRAPMNP